MILITKSQRKQLDDVGLLQYKKTGINAQDPNFVVINKEHMSRNKRYYVVETPEILAFLQKYETLNLQKIKPSQVEELLNKKLITKEQIQNPGEYKPNAFVFIDDYGVPRMKKVIKFMIELGYWKARPNQVVESNGEY